VLVKPLVGWIWYGALVLTVGSLIALWPSVEKRRVAEATPAGEPVSVGAD
jgi:cytochrome c biogenesis factor